MIASMRARFIDRRDAGRRLAAELTELADERPVIIALPRGGVPVGLEVARALGAPLEILAVRKLGAPGNPELGVGAVAEDGTGVLDPRSAGMFGMTRAMLDETLARESRELRRRVERYRDNLPAISVAGRSVIVVDDGLATGLTDLAAVRALRKRGAASIVVAAPVGSREAMSTLAEEADRVVCVTVPERLLGVGMWYSDFTPVSDAEVLALLAEAAGEAAASTPAASAPIPGASAAGAVKGQAAVEELAFDLDGIRLAGTLGTPEAPKGLVLFAHGSGSSRMSPRNRAVAQALQGAGLATLLFDLLSGREAERRELVFDIALLAGRLKALTRWAASQPSLRSLPIGYFGASTGAAAALRAAAELGGVVAAVVSRGGRPDLAGDHLSSVVSPTILIVGARDTDVLEVNRSAAELLRCPHELAVVSGASHLFEEPGALERVSELAIEWLERYLPRKPNGASAGARREAWRDGGSN
jgi:putative phosphoribosyl transferase